MGGVLLASVGLALLTQGGAAAEERDASVLAHRGYYFTFTRMPTYGLDAWKDIIDCVREDDGNTVILYMSGAFRSRAFPETWAHNRDHANVKEDFVRELIDYAHERGVKALLGFTPFGYDGVNRMSLTRPEWRATGPDGQTVAKFGFHSWGYNLCPARPDTQAFMLAYAREMIHEFYPNADGLLIESSDYAACHCKDCGARFYEHEFRFVKAISEEMWAMNPDAFIIVYPHYFTGNDVPGLGVAAAREPFDPRWALVFTPHSAHPDPDLIAQARGAIWWDEAVARHGPRDIREGVRRAVEENCTGYLPSLEVFTYVPTEPEEGQAYIVGKRRVPYGFGWLDEGRMPYDELPVRVNRIAYRAYCRMPDLSDEAFRTLLGRALFGSAATAESVADALEIQRIYAADRTWCQPAPLLDPERVRAMREAGELTEPRIEAYRVSLNRAQEIASRYRNKGEAFAALRRAAQWIADLWGERTETFTGP